MGYRIYLRLLFYPFPQVFLGTSKKNLLLESDLFLSTGSLHTVYMTPDNPGEWKLICSTSSHTTRGMEATYTVRENCGNVTSTQPSGTIRRYFIAAVEETWDYVPFGRDLVEGKALEDSEYVYHKYESIHNVAVQKLITLKSQSLSFGLGQPVHGVI